MPVVPIGFAIAGGLLMAAGVGVLLLCSGRVGGIGGCFGAIINRDAGQDGWRMLYLVGLILGGVITAVFWPERLDVSQLNRPMGFVLASGVLMGFGGRMGNGCTSGHGVCGIARLSKRSLAATCTFFGMALITLYVSKYVLGVFG